MVNKSFYYFIKPTLKLSLAGIFIAGFTAILFFFVQTGLTYLGVECSMAWIILWIITTIGAVASPIIFIRKLKKSMEQGYDLTPRDIIIFNLIEYSFIQCSLAALVSSSKTLCYTTNGQNGLQFVFTAWIAIPILITLSLLFDQIRKIKYLEVRS